jgi:hypothetical protein
MEIAVEHRYWPPMNRESLAVRVSFQINSQTEDANKLYDRFSNLLFPLWLAPRNFSRKDLQL